jgi:CheY-like chemotaxis protein
LAGAPAVSQSRLPVVAVFNANTDIVEMLRFALEHAGMIVITGHVVDAVRGALDIPALVSQHDPKAIVYDIAPPYERNWQFLQHLRTMPELQGRAFVLTSTHVANLRKLVGTDEDVHEILGKPYDIEEIVKAVQATVKHGMPGA